MKQYEIECTKHGKITVYGDGTQSCPECEKKETVPMAWYEERKIVANKMWGFWNEALETNEILKRDIDRLKGVVADNATLSAENARLCEQVAFHQGRYEGAFEEVARLRDELKKRDEALIYVKERLIEIGKNPRSIGGNAVDNVEKAIQKIDAVLGSKDSLLKGGQG